MRGPLGGHSLDEFHAFGLAERRHLPARALALPRKAAVLASRDGGGLTWLGLGLGIWLGLELGVGVGLGLGLDGSGLTQLRLHWLLTFLLDLPARTGCLDRPVVREHGGRRELIAQLGGARLLAVLRPL